MISTRNVNVALAKQRRLQNVTTKTIDVSPKITKPALDPVRKSPLITTHTIGDVADMEERRVRGEIALQRKNSKKGDLTYLDDKGKLVTDEKPGETLKEFAVQDVPFVGGDVVKDYQAIEVPVEKPWNKMNAEERKEYQEAKKETK